MKKKTNKKPWFIFEDAANCNPTLITSYMNSYLVENFLKKHGIRNNPKKYLTIFEKGRYKLCFEKKRYEKCSQEVLNQVIANPLWAQKINGDLIKRSDEFFVFAKSTLKMNLGRFSNKELVLLLEKFYQKQAAMHTLGWLGNVIDFGNNYFSNYLLGYLKEAVKKKRIKIQPKIVFSVLTTPLKEGFAQKEYLNYLNILELIQKNKSLKNIFQTSNIDLIEEKLMHTSFGRRINKLINLHVKKFGWLGYGVEGPAWDKHYYLDLLKNLIRENVNPEKERKQLQKVKEETILNKQEYIKLLAIDEGHQQLFKVAEELVFTKGYRKDVIFHGFYCLEYILREFGRRTNLALKQTRYVYPWEYGRVLKEKEKWSDELNSRWDYHLFYSLEGKHKILTGKKAYHFVDKLSFVVTRQKKKNKLEGDCASPGKVRGVVAIINSPKENNKMEKADILVSAMTNPNLMPAIRKAKAIVTDYGGLTCHAAIVAREFGIPCIIGTQDATQILNDGALVEVDATHGVVNIIKK